VAVPSNRREARERALGLLYEAEVRGLPAADVVDAQPLAPDSFAVELVTGVADHVADLDALIGRYARGWSVERMPTIDRLLLRMGAYELVHRPDVPPAVSISEAVGLAKRFSTEDSGRFVNGVLAAVAAQARPDEARSRPGR
jgi:transcription antitermination protein NusB